MRVPIRFFFFTPTCYKKYDDNFAYKRDQKIANGDM